MEIEHVFQGRYRSVPVNGEDADGYYFRIAADYIHLNPARAGLAGGDRGKLAAYRWSSFFHYAKSKGPEWLETGRVLRAFELAQDARGRRGYVGWLEARAKAGGELTAEATACLRRGWYLGEERFRDRLLKWLEKPPIRRKESWSGEVVRDRSLQEAERLVREGAGHLGLPLSAEKLSALRKGDRSKVLLAMLLRKRTIASNEWIARRLMMGEAGSVSRLVIGGKKDNRLK